MPLGRTNRRAFIVALSGAAAWPVVARAQQPTKVSRLGVLLFSNPYTDPNIETVRSGLRGLGYVQGRDVTFIYRYAEGNPERLADLAADLVREKPDLILALGGDVAPHAVKATSTIPIVFVSSADPVQLGLVASLSRPKGNATGITLLLDDTASKRLELLKEAVPNVKRAAFLWNPEHPDNEPREAERAAESLNMRLQFVEMRSTRDLGNALRTVADVGADAMYVVSSRQTVLNMRPIVEFAIKNQLPLAAGWGAWARAGGLLSFGPDINEMVRSVTSYLDRIMKGAKPADLPVQQPTKFELVINAKVGKMIGIDVPPSLLARADEVIE